jgi:M6 family metalloprotease-like protein
MRFFDRFRKLWVVIGVMAVVMMLAAPVAGDTGIYPDPPPDFSVIDDSYAHGDLLSPLGGQTDRHLLVLYVEFADLPFEGADVPPDPRFDHLNHMTAWAVHEQYFGAFPSARGYFEEVSDGRLMLEPVPVSEGANEDEVDGVVQISIDEDRDPNWVGSPAEELEFLIEEASQYVDFSQFANEDGEITELELSIVRHDTDDRLICQPDLPGDLNCNSPEVSGGGLIDRGPSTSFEVDDVSFRNFSSGRYRFVLTRTATNLMTIVHELGHQLFDMPDSYFQQVGTRTDIGGGTVNAFYNDLFRPNAWHYMHLGWAGPTVVTRSGYYDVPRDPAGSSFILYDPDRGTDDYFIVENRAPVAGTYDQGVGSTGLMIWRVDESEYAVQRTTGWIELIGGSAWSPSDRHDDPRRTADGLTWRDGTETDIAVRAISPAGDVMRVYFDVRGPGVLVDPILRDSSGAVVFPGVTPGVENEIRVPVMNTGEEIDTFDVFFDGPADWDTIAYEIELEAGEEADTFPTIIPPADVPVDALELTVIAESTTDALVSEQSTLPVVVVLDRTSIEYTGETYVPIDEPAGFEVVVTNIDDDDEPIEGVEVTFELTGDGGELISTGITGSHGVAEANPVIDLPPGDYQVVASTERFGRHDAASTTVAYRIPTAEERIGDLLDDIVTAELHHGIENSLSSTVGQALTKLEDDMADVTCHTLGAFRNQLDAQDGRHIPADIAEGFRHDVDGILAQLDC